MDKGGAGSHGANCNLKGGHPITFDESALDSAEDMGFDANTMQPIKDGDSVCKDEPKICTFKPAPGAAKDDGLNTFVGEDPNGKWYFCVGDADSSLHQTDFREFALTVWAI